jgi:cytochrome c oxidase subunit II
MEINSYERVWMGISVTTILVMLILVTLAGFGLGVQMPGAAGMVDARTVAKTAPFDQPGLTETGPGKYQVIMLAQALPWSFNPKEITVPVGSEVTFKVTSKDVTHGLLVENTNINVMVVPGQVTEFTVRFSKAGTYQYLCHEYCGVGHQTMAGQIIVAP